MDESTEPADEPDATIDFMGPPPQATTGSRHAEIAAALKQRPGEWAVVRRTDTANKSGAAAQAIRSGRLRAYAPTGAYEAVARTVDGEHRVYARYVGGAK